MARGYDELDRVSQGRVRSMCRLWKRTEDWSLVVVKLPAEVGPNLVQNDPGPADQS